MGLRHERHVFQPNVFVFPGGRVERADGSVRAATEPSAAMLAQLARGALTPSRARAVTMAAIRETFEECGLRIAGTDPAPDTPSSEHWHPFFASGYAPSADRLVHFCRAITPPNRVRPYDTRFFLFDGSSLPGEAKPSRELTGVRWVTLDEATTLELPRMTQRVIPRLAALLADAPKPGEDRPVQYYRMIRGQPVWTEL